MDQIGEKHKRSWLNHGSLLYCILVDSVCLARKSWLEKLSFSSLSKFERKREKEREREIEIKERKEEREREKAPFLTSDKTSKWSWNHPAQRCPVTNVDHLWWLLCSSS